MTSILFQWDGEAMVPLPKFAAECDAEYVVGYTYVLEAYTPQDQRSRASHAHYFAMVSDLWQNLPERYAGEPWAATPDHLRKYALISTGWHKSTSHPVASGAEARRTAATVRSLTPSDDFVIAVPRGDVVEVYRAKSQSYKGMRKADFQQSKDDVIAFIKTLVGIEEAAA